MRRDALGPSMLRRRLLAVCVLVALIGGMACEDDPRNKLIGDPDFVARDAAPDVTLDLDATDDDAPVVDTDSSLGGDTSANDVTTGPDVRDSTVPRDTGPDVRDAGRDARDADADG
jgi:hypothetical protein